MVRDFILMLVIAVISLSGCSRSDKLPTIPAQMDDLSLLSLGDDAGEIPNHQILGLWDVAIEPYIDREEDAPSFARQQGFTIVPNRQLAYHFNVTPWIPAPHIKLISYDKQTKIVYLDMTITNPFAIYGYDVRLIVYTDSIGHKLTNADDWTSLYDLPGGFPINPFKAYAKSQANHKFDGQTQYTERCNIYLPDGDLHFTIAIDASYPTNCEEPYELTNFTQGIILDQLGSSTELEVTAHSWSNDVNSVRLYCPQITGTALVSFNPIDSEKWGITLTNSTGAQSGNYFGYLIATTSKSGSLALYDEVTIKITPLNSGWARTWGGVGDDEAQDVAVDDDGNIYSTGGFMSTVDFNPDAEGEDIHTSNGYFDVFLVKYDKYGNFQWARTWGGTYPDRGNSVDIDNSGNVLVSGSFSSTVDFGTGGAHDIQTSSGGEDCFLTKYTSDGDYLWTRTWGGGGYDWVKRINIDKSNNICLTGTFEGSADFNPDPTQTDRHTSVGGYDVFASKLNSSGVFQWAKTWGSISEDFGMGVSIDSGGAVYCSGYFDGTCDFDPGSGNDIHSANGSWQDAYLSKFDSNGNFQWAHTWGSTYQDEAWECAVDEFDDVYVVGRFYYTVDFNPDPLETEERTAVWYDDVFVSKFAPNGDFKWVLTWGGPSLDYGRVISSDHNGHFWVGGYAYNCDFDPGSGTDFKEGGFYISKFEITGDYIWSQLWDPDVRIVGFDVEGFGKSYFCGWYGNDNPDFDPGPKIWKSQNYSNGWDCFIVKVLSNGLWE